MGSLPRAWRGRGGVPWSIWHFSAQAAIRHRMRMLLCIDWDPSERRLIFQKEGEVVVLPVAAPQPQTAVQAAEASQRPCGGSPLDRGCPRA